MPENETPSMRFSFCCFFSMLPENQFPKPGSLRAFIKCVVSLTVFRGNVNIFKGKCGYVIFFFVGLRF